MVKLIKIVSAILIAASIVSAQVTTYTFSQSSGTYTEISGGTVVASGSSIDEANYSAQAIGFTFNFNGTNYTTLGVNSNGAV
ncbi:MAG: hypothetical protein ACOYNS_14015, partial [Bacteroidota bacterium]